MKYDVYEDTCTYGNMIRYTHYIELWQGVYFVWYLDKMCSVFGSISVHRMWNISVFVGKISGAGETNVAEMSGLGSAA